MTKLVKVDKKAAKKNTAKYNKWREANKQEPYIQFDVKSKENSSNPTKSKNPVKQVQTHNDALKQSSETKAKAKQTIQNAAAKAKEKQAIQNAAAAKDIRPQLKKASSGENSLQQARQMNAQVAAELGRAATPNVIKHGLGVTGNNLLYGLKQTLDNFMAMSYEDAERYRLARTGNAALANAFSADVDKREAQKWNQASSKTALKQAEDLQKLNEKYQYDKFTQAQRVGDTLITGVGTMLPALAAGAVTGGAASLPVMGAIAGGMGANQALNEGATKEEARDYATLSSLKEMGTELMFAGYGKMAPGILKPSWFTGKIANPMARRGANFALGSLEEGVEEGVAEYLDPYIQRHTYNPNAENATLQEIGQAALLGGLTAGVLKGVAGMTMIPRASANVANSLRNPQGDNAADTALHGAPMSERIAQQEQIRAGITQNAENAAGQAINNQTTNNMQNVRNAAQTANNIADNLEQQVQTGNPAQTNDIIPKLQRPTLEMADRTFENVGARNVKAYQQENPAVKPYYQATAEALLSDLQMGIKGGRDAGIDPETRNVTIMNGWQRQQSEPINRMLNDGMSYGQIEDGLERIIRDHGDENTANAKRAELYVDDAVRNGYSSIVNGDVAGNMEMQYLGMSGEQLRSEYDHLENSFTGDEVQDAATISQMETIHNLLERMQPNDITPKLQRPQQEAAVSGGDNVQQPGQFVDYDINRLSSGSRQWMERVGSVSGMNVRVVDGLPHNANGMFDGEGNIILDGNQVNSAESMRKVLGHEVYHAMRSTDEHKDLQDLAWEWYQLEHQNATQQDMLNEKIAQYAESGVTLDAESAWDEVGAEFAERLVTDEEMARRVIAEQPNLAQRILRKIQEILRRFTGNLSEMEQQQRDILLEAEEIYRDGLQSMQYQEGTQGESRYSFPDDSEALKERQFAVIQNSNPMQDDYHTGIRDIDDILTFEEAIEEAAFTPDYTEKMAQDALRKGKITIYSSYPISQGVFVTPSKMEAQNYVGGGKVYSKTVPLSDVAWIDTIEGQYAKTDNDSDIRYNLNNERDTIGSEEYKTLLDEYGTMPEGENPTGNNHRVEVPKSTAEGNQVRQFVRNVIESPSVDDATANLVAEKLINDTGGDFVHEPITNKAVLNDVNKRIKENGWKQEYEALHGGVQAGNRITAEDVAMGTRLIQEAQKAGDYKATVNLVTDLAVAGTELGQSIQAYRMLKRLTPEGQLLTLKKAQRRINQNLQKQGKRPVAEISEETAMEFMQVRSNRRRDEIWNREIARMGQETEGDWMDKLDALRYAAMLSNPKTHVRNIVGNVVMSIVRQPTILASAAMEEVQDRVMRPNGMAPEHYRTITNRTGQSRKELKNYAELNYKAFAKQVLQSGGSRYQDVSGQFANNQRVFGDSLPGRVLEQLAGSGNYSVSSMLEAEDMWFKHKVYVAALTGYMRANGITTAEAAKRIVKPNGASIEKGEQYALRQAEKATFTEKNRVANALSNLENINAATKVLLGGWIPFKKTPMNIVTRGVEYSPAGLGMTGYKMVRAIKGTKDKYGRGYNINDVFESLAANLTGTALMYLGYSLAIEGFLAGTGDDDDKRKAKYDRQMGSQNYSVTDPETGESWTIDWLSPAAMPLFAGVEMYNLLNTQYDVEEESNLMQVAGALSRIADPIFEMSCMQGVASALASYSGDSGDIASTVGANLLMSYPAQFIPAVAGAAARTIDDRVRSSYAPKVHYDDGSLILPKSIYSKGAESFLRQQRGKIPGLSQKNMASIDVWGNVRRREYAGNDASDFALRAFNNFINPSSYSSDKRTALDRELEALYQSTGDSRVLPALATGMIDETKQNPKISMTPLEYSRFSTTKGKKSHQYVSEFVKSDTYKQLDDSEKADVISDLYSLANYEARKQILNGAGRGYNYSLGDKEKALGSGVKPYEYYAASKRFNGTWSNYDNASEYAAAADKIGMSDEMFVSHYNAMKAIKGKGEKAGRIAYLDKQAKNGNLTREQYWYLRMTFAGTKQSKADKRACPYKWMVKS